MKRRAKMKKQSSLFLMIVLAVSVNVLQAAELCSRVTRATVFTDHAMITREGTIRLSAGEH
jgi:hypothetical protein